MDIGRVPFRGSEAVAAGRVGKGALRGPRFVRLLPDVYVAAGATLDLRTRAVAAHLHSDRRGIVAGWAAAELLGAECAPVDAPAEIVLPGGDRRRRAGLRVHRFLVSPVDVVSVAGVPVTSAVRTAFDVARRESLTAAVVAVDALARAGRFAPAAVLDMAQRYPGMRGVRALPRVVGLADVRSESAAESRVRMAILLAGLPAPEVQYRVGRYRLDLAYPQVRLGIEYDGRGHLVAGRARRDLRREADLVRAGWEVLHLGGDIATPREIAIRVWRALDERGVPTPNVSPERVAELS